MAHRRRRCDGCYELTDSSLTKYGDLRLCEDCWPRRQEIAESAAERRAKAEAALRKQYPVLYEEHDRYTARMERRKSLLEETTLAVWVDGAHCYHLARRCNERFSPDPINKIAVEEAAEYYEPCICVVRAVDTREPALPEEAKTLIRNTLSWVCGECWSTDKGRHYQGCPKLRVPTWAGVLSVILSPIGFLLGIVFGVVYWLFVLLPLQLLGAIGVVPASVVSAFRDAFRRRQ